MCITTDKTDKPKNLEELLTFIDGLRSAKYTEGFYLVMPVKKSNETGEKWYYFVLKVDRQNSLDMNMEIICYVGGQYCINCDEFSPSSFEHILQLKEEKLKDGQSSELLAGIVRKANAVWVYPRLDIPEEHKKYMKSINVSLSYGVIDWFMDTFYSNSDDSKSYSNQNI